MTEPSTNSFSYSFNVNSSLEQVLEPFSDSDFAFNMMLIPFMFIEIYMMYSRWQKYGKKSPTLLKNTLALMYASFIFTMPFALMTTIQTASLSHIPFYMSQGLYCVVLSSTYLVLFAKQNVIFSFGVSNIISDKLSKKRDFLIQTFKIQLGVYVAGILILPFIPTIFTIVLSETSTTQGVRVVYIHPVWLRILVAFADTGLSITSLLLFFIPLIALKQHLHNSGNRIVVTSSHSFKSAGGANQKSKLFAKRLYDTCWINFKWTALSIVTTFMFLALAGSLQPHQNSTWLFLGVVDGWIRLYTIGKLLRPSEHSNARRKKKRPSIIPESVQTPSVLSVVEHTKPANLFD